MSPRKESIAKAEEGDGNAKPDARSADQFRGASMRTIASFLRMNGSVKGPL